MINLIFVFLHHKYTLFIHDIHSHMYTHIYILYLSINKKDVTWSAQLNKLEFKFYQEAKRKLSDFFRRSLVVPHTKLQYQRQLKWLLQVHHPLRFSQQLHVALYLLILCHHRHEVG